jgi:integrase
MQLRKFGRSPYWFVVARDSNGKRYVRSTKQTSRDAAARAGRAIELEGAVPRLPRHPLSEALVALAQHKARRRVSAAETEIVRTKGGHLIAHFGPGRDIGTLEPTDIDGYVDARRRAEVRPGKNISDSTIRMELRCLYEALRNAKRAGRYSGDVDRLRSTALAAYKPRERWLPHGHFLALLEQLGKLRKGSANRADYVLAWCHTGVRKSELLRVLPEHLDRQGRRLFVDGRKGSREHRRRWVPLSDAAFAVLERRADATPVGQPLFAPWPNSNIRRVLANACAKIGIEPVTPNDLRRSYISWHLHAGTSELEAQRYAGHSPRSTLVRTVYGQLKPDAGQAAVASFPAPPAPPGVSQTVSQTGGRLRGLGGARRTS